MSDALDEQDRILLIGATGWFGRTALRLLAPFSNDVLPIASRARTLETAQGHLEVYAWDFARIVEFQPTLILDSAFLTRGLLGSIPAEEFIHQNQLLSDRLLAATGISSVKRVISVSSGAAIYPAGVEQQPVIENPYGVLKLNLERRLLRQAEESGFNVVIPRAWSVSGPEVQSPKSYAFSDLILQARTGQVRISAQNNVWRRYTAADDLLSVAFALSSAGSRIFSSGGELVEIGQLARLVVSEVGGASILKERILRGGQGDSDDYHSDGTEWQSVCDELQFSPKNLTEQISATNFGLLDH
jgi:nucleoside-diphosphate-sugar epimerase